MKKQILTLIIVLTTMVCFAQKIDTTIFNGATKIVIKNGLSASENYKLAGQLMQELGYTIGAKDAEFKQISTEAVKVQAQGAAHMLSIYAISKDNQVTIVGKTKNLSTIKLVGWQDNESAVEVIPYKKTRQLSRAIFFKTSAYAKAFKPESLIFSE